MHGGKLSYIGNWPTLGQHSIIIKFINLIMYKSIVTKERKGWHVDNFYCVGWSGNLPFNPPLHKQPSSRQSPIQELNFRGLTRTGRFNVC